MRPCCATRLAATARPSCIRQALSVRLNATKLHRPGLFDTRPRLGIEQLVFARGTAFTRSNPDPVEGARVGRRIRTATLDDLDGLIQLDAKCFPNDDLDRERAAPGELAAGIQSKSITLTLEEDRIIGFLHEGRCDPPNAFISAVAVDPDEQSEGVGAELLDNYLRRLGGSSHMEVSVATVTSMRNRPMQRLLFSRGFIARRSFEDYYGDGKHRLYMQLSLGYHYTHPDDRYLIPADSPAVERMLATERYSITNLIETDAGWTYEISRLEEDDVASLQSSEADAGIAFSTAVLASLTFLMGFAFASNQYPDSVRLILMAAILGTTLSLIIYANASGELARIRSNEFNRYMKWGNALSEYTGVFPFAIVLPAVFAQVVGSGPEALLAGGVVALALGAYESSRFALIQRYRRSALTMAGRLLSPIAAVTGVLFANSPREGPVWAVATILILLGRVATLVPSEFQEQAVWHRGMRSRARQ